MAKHEELPIPVFSSLEPVYGEGSQAEEAELRFNNLKTKFVQVFGHPPHVFARAPGSLSLSLSVICLESVRIPKNGCKTV